MIRLDPADRLWLLEAARLSIRQKLFDDGSLTHFLRGNPPPVATQAPRGAFVTIRQPTGREASPQQLRGCVGTTEARRPLHETVIDLAPQSAIADPRFEPLTRTEYETIRIGVSVLCAFKTVDDPSEIVPGRDGVRLVLGKRQALFLPQVATEQRWDLDQLLRQLSAKAGLAPDGWSDAALERFGAETFAESS